MQPSIAADVFFSARLVASLNKGTREERGVHVQVAVYGLNCNRAHVLLLLKMNSCITASIFLIFSAPGVRVTLPFIIFLRCQREFNVTAINIQMNTSSLYFRKNAQTMRRLLVFIECSRHLVGGEYVFMVLGHLDLLGTTLLQVYAGVGSVYSG